ncbi:MAG TPA: AarF/UbiB family protein [Anaerolineae bacterium]|nr:AarF/UbiB family protein [Anaerolineae bacterium]
MSVTTATPTKEERKRYWRILRFFALVIAHVVLWDLIVGRYLPMMAKSNRDARYQMWSRRFRDLALDMGGVMIKLGQFLSSRVDVLPVSITSELKGLQDEVPPVPYPLIQRQLEQELGDFRRHFRQIEREPLAAASLGQTYRAWLQDGSDEDERGVVIKVQRPGIENTVRIDLDALRIVARWLMRYRPIARRANVPDLMEEFAETLLEELDYRQEANNAERFTAMFAEDDRVLIPKIYREYSTGRVLVLQNVAALPIDDVATLEAAGINPKVIAERLLDVYFRQIFREGFFHADPHAGNLFIQPLEGDVIEEDGWETRPFQLTFIDFGMVGHVEAAMSRNLGRLLASVSQQDAQELTMAYRDMGFFLPGADFERMVEVQRTVLEQIWGRKLLDLARPDPEEVKQLGLQFRDVLFEFPFQIPQDFIYLGRALGMISGLTSLLNPEINPWYHVEKYGRELVQSKEGKALSREALAAYFQPWLALPGQVQSIVKQAERGQLRVKSILDKQVQRQLDQLVTQTDQIQTNILVAAGLISGALLYGDGAHGLAWGIWGVAAFIYGWRAFWRS